MPRITPYVTDRIMTFRAAWRELAPTATFAGMDLAEFETASGPPLALRADIAALELQLDGKKSAKTDADMAATDLLDLVVNSVRGTPGFGPDSPLYRALGYVRKSERKSGLTRKGATPAVDANVA
jgi:hypothetical protein